jgi:uncharacterized protein YdiU (UPF0061 family)
MTIIVDETTSIQCVSTETQCDFLEEIVQTRMEAENRQLLSLVDELEQKHRGDIAYLSQSLEAAKIEATEYRKLLQESASVVMEAPNTDALISQLRQRLQQTEANYSAVYSECNELKKISIEQEEVYNAKFMEIEARLQRERDEGIKETRRSMKDFYEVEVERLNVEIKALRDQVSSMQPHPRGPSAQEEPARKRESAHAATSSAATKSFFLNDKIASKPQFDCQVQHQIEGGMAVRAIIHDSKVGHYYTIEGNRIHVFRLESSMVPHIKPIVLADPGVIILCAFVC